MFIVIPSLEELPTMANEVFSSHGVRLSLLHTNSVLLGLMVEVSKEIFKNNKNVEKPINSNEHYANIEELSS